MEYFNCLFLFSNMYRCYSSEKRIISQCSNLKPTRLRRCRHAAPLTFGSGAGSAGSGRGFAWLMTSPIYIYIYTWNLIDLFFGVPTTQNMVQLPIKTKVMSGFQVIMCFIRLHETRILSATRKATTMRTLVIDPIYIYIASSKTGARPLPISQWHQGRRIPTGLAR